VDSLTRLNLIARITYYAGWIFLLLGGLAHVGVGSSLFQTIALPQRNLFEGALSCFLICSASALRALTFSK